eukprot:1231570-Amorphochlora_amoeboformis.AAC.2
MTSLNVVINHPGQAHYVDGDLPSRSASRRITYRGVKHSECIGWCELASRNSQVISVRGRRVKMRGELKESLEATCDSSEVLVVLHMHTL